MDQDVLLKVASIAVPGLVVWIWALWMKVGNLELKLAERYHNKDELRQMIVELLQPIRDDLRQLKERVRP